ncbi:nose resistant to fluoxetine protein 6 [Dermacentor silvarum]|uniref:nose resistant to fluoxetine protein 6 n=1 Tax=Dermacentor silvarum TaxID=543639 RepID=UPI002100EEB4|nr:nose resistant to fluoxetine protein 6 [Dermacentor silvarum]
MLPRPSKGRIGRDASVAEFALRTTLVLFLIGAPGTRAQSASTDTSSGGDSTTMSPIQATSLQQVDEIDYAELLREVVDYGFSKLPPSLLRNFIQAGLQPQCSIALIRTLKGILDFEPWALRLFDASGKFPTGMFQGSHMDAGAFDECLETVVHHGHRDVVSRGQYCNLLIYAQNGTAMRDTVELLSKYLHPKVRLRCELQYFKDYYSIEDVPFVRLGICFTDECNRNDLQALVNIGVPRTKCAFPLIPVKPPLVRLEVSNCVTAEPEPWDKIQTAIVLFLGVLLVIVLISTLVDELWNTKPKQEKENGTLLEFVSAFSVTANTRHLLKVPENIHCDGYDLQFMHGMRFFCCIHIVLGLFFTNLSDIWARVLNLFITSDHWPHMIATAMFNSVDTFFFIRLLFPLTFVVMCLYPLPHFVAGPDVKAFFVKLNDEIDKHWWKLLLHIRNFYGSAVVGAHGNERSCGPVADLDCVADPARNSIVTAPPPPSPLVHVWYLSADFQLFLISLLVASIFKRPLRLNHDFHRG